MTEEIPQLLYKIVSVQDWYESETTDRVKLPPIDAAFIHFSTEDQLDAILDKYWSNVPELIVLAIDSDQLPGRMAFETNPGGKTKYYHLYNGYIPRNAVLDVKVYKN